MELAVKIAMKIAGLGFRRAASMADLAEALAMAQQQAGRADALATIAGKAAAPAIRALAARTGLPLIAVPAVAGIDTPTRSPRVMALHGTGCLAEAAALAALRPGAAILVRRTVSSGGMATAAIATGEPL